MDIKRPERRLAMLIDADNAAPNIIVGLMAEVSKYGVATVKRIYGDWTTPNLGGWKKVLLDHSITPIQQFRYSVGKNATDSAMIIDAMDILYAGKMDGFCLVSSDSDFTRLASRIRESGLPVYGFGERKTPSAFVSACDKFTFVDIFLEPTKANSHRKEEDVRRDSDLVNLLGKSVEACANDDGWARLTDVGVHLSAQRPEFDSRNYGYAKLSMLVEAAGAFEIRRERVGPQGQTIVVFVRDPSAKE